MRRFASLSRCLASATWFALAALGAPESARGDEVSKLLARPASPGSIALLAAHTTEAGVPERLKLSLASPSPEVRGAAARVINLGGLTGLVPDVRSALEAEPDPDAAAEEIRALVSIGGPSSDDTAIANAARFAPRLDGELVRILARVRGPSSLATYFQKLRLLSLTPSDRKDYFRLAAGGQNETLNAAVSMAFGSQDSDSWRAALSVAAELDRTLDQPVFLRALRSSESPVLRGEAAWYLAKAYCRTPPMGDDDLLAAVSEPDPQPGTVEDPELRFGAEMLRRVLGKAPVEDEGWIACLESNLTCHLDSDFVQSPLIDYLTPREREAVLMRNHARESKGKVLKGNPSPDRLAQKPNLRLVAKYPKGVARDLLEIGGCRENSRSWRYGLALLEFRRDGLPRHVSLLAVPDNEPCKQVAESLFLLSLAPEDESSPENSRLIYLALFDPESLVCSERSFLASASSPAEGAGGILRVRAGVVAPRLLQKKEPEYPLEARKKGEKGISIYEAIISSTGCVSDLRLLKSTTSTLLDVSGMRAISQWKYAPATLDRRPVAVYLTVTVTYNLP